MRDAKKKKGDTPGDGLPSLSRNEFLILEMLMGSGRELYGLQMVEASNGALKKGTVYVTLQRMQEKGLLESKPEPRPAPEIGIPRRLYWVSGYGQQVNKAYEAARAVLALELLPTKA